MTTRFPIQDFQKLETPFYYYDTEILDQTLKDAHQAASQYGFILHYALKANSNQRILERISNLGFGADCVSGNEITRALQTGFEPSKIVFAGVGKSDREILTALSSGIFAFNCESVQEIEVIDELARKKGVIARIALRINPNIDAHTHHYITTGIEENKFGINAWEWEPVLNLVRSKKHLELSGLHFHIGSQIEQMDVFKGLCTRVNEIQDWFISRQVVPSHINVGGGLGVDYSDPDGELPDFEGFFRLFHDHLDLKPGQELHFEPGRSLVAQSGSLISRVLYIKEGIKTRFAILDAGMTELIRPALYQAYHKIQNLSSAKQPLAYDVVGPICESSDCFGKSVVLPETQRGDLIAIRTAGAYGEVMSSEYNLRSRVRAYYDEDFKRDVKQ